MDKKRGWTLVLTSLGFYLIAGILFLIGTLIGGVGATEGDASAVVGALMFFVIGFIMLGAWYIVFVVWFGLQNRDMNEMTGRSFNTTLWVILLFIPIANIVALYKYADHIHEAQTVRGVTGMHPVVVFLLMWLINLIGWPLAQTQMDKLG